MGRDPGHVPPVPDDATRFDRHQPGDGAKECRLAGARGPEDGDGLPILDLQGHVSQDVVAVETDVEPLHLQHQKLPISPN